MRALLAFLSCLAAFSAAAASPRIADWPIRFDAERIQLTLDYIESHYKFRPKNIHIIPRAIVIHWTEIPSLKRTWRVFNRVRLRPQRRLLQQAGRLNLSAHFLVDRNGSIYRLMPENWMARHCIGLNYDSIGIENVGGGSKYPLTSKQLEANARLVRYLANKHPVRYLLGHMESKRFESAPIFRERDPRYRTVKKDPGRRFMRRLRNRVLDLGLLDAPAPTP